MGRNRTSSICDSSPVIWEEVSKSIGSRLACGSSGEFDPSGTVGGTSFAGVGSEENWRCERGRIVDRIHVAVVESMPHCDEEDGAADGPALRRGRRRVRGTLDAARLIVGRWAVGSSRRLVPWQRVFSHEALLGCLLLLRALFAAELCCTSRTSRATFGVPVHEKGHNCLSYPRPKNGEWGQYFRVLVENGWIVVIDDVPDFR